MLRGSQAMQAHIENRLGIKPGQTTTDGKFTFSLVECLGSCGSAPCMSYNDDYVQNITIETLDELIDKELACK
jgi:NADH-quinone oxidoreductase subunit E